MLLNYQDLIMQPTTNCYGPVSSPLPTILSLQDKGFHLNKQEFCPGHFTANGSWLIYLVTTCLCITFYPWSCHTSTWWSHLCASHEICDLTAEWLNKLCYDVINKPLLHATTWKSVNPKYTVYHSCPALYIVLGWWWLLFT